MKALFTSLFGALFSLSLYASAFSDDPLAHVDLDFEAAASSSTTAAPTAWPELPISVRSSHCFHLTEDSLHGLNNGRKKQRIKRSQMQTAGEEFTPELIIPADHDHTLSGLFRKRFIPETELADIMEKMPNTLDIYLPIQATREALSYLIGKNHEMTMRTKHAFPHTEGYLFVHLNFKSSPFVEIMDYEIDTPILQFLAIDPRIEMFRQFGFDIHPDATTIADYVAFMQAQSVELGLHVEE